ncbi:hypothetical protein [Dongia sp.]|uniref:hypothetical protein n=1 Tax=Dongia sp. TaxID=1977262 RepID=UPI003752BB9B
MRTRSLLGILFAGLIVAGLVRFARADEVPPDASLKLQGDATFDVELQRRKTPVCGVEWDFLFAKKDIDFSLVWIGDGIDRRHFVLKTEVWRHSVDGQCEFAELVDRMDVSVFDASAGNATPLYSLSLAPEVHDEFTDLSIAETVGPFLKLYTGERDGRADHFKDPGGPYRYYDLRSGKLLFLADELGSVAELTVKGATDASRFIGLSVRRGTIAAGSEEDKAGYVATVTYASRDGILQQAKVLGISGPAIRYDELNPRITLIGGNVYGGDLIGGEAAKSGGEIVFRPGASDAETFDGCTVRVALTESITLDIPLTKDRLDFVAAGRLTGFTLSVIQ